MNIPDLNQELSLDYEYFISISIFIYILLEKLYFNLIIFFLKKLFM